MNTRATIPELVIMLGSVVLFIAAVFWGVLLGFPEPDASAEEAAAQQFHASVSGWGMVLALVGFTGSCLALIRAWLIARRQ